MDQSNEISCTLERAQELTGYSRQRLYQAISAGRLKTWKAGRRRMTSPKYLREMIELDQRASEQGRAA
jgi:hypothetical protein